MLRGAEACEKLCEPREKFTAPRSGRPPYRHSPGGSRAGLKAIPSVTLGSTKKDFLHLATRAGRESSIDDEQDKLVELMRAIASGSAARALALLDGYPRLATAQAVVGATATSSESYFFTTISHYVYQGDTALHIAAAAFDASVAKRLLQLGADCGAKNRRGAQPLHYASDTNREDSKAQAKTIQCLCAAGANPNALDASGVAPLHRAVRTRGAAAVEALLALGAAPRLKNKSGSTPLHLAVQTTGRGGSGDADALVQQKRIIQLLLEHGARPSDKDGRGRTVASATSSDWIRALLEPSKGR